MSEPAQRPLRVLHLVWSGEIGGTENFVFDLAREQARRSAVALGWMSRSAGRPASMQGVALFEFGMRSGFDVRAYVRGLPWVRTFAPDIVHVHDATPLAFWTGWASSAPVTVAHVHTIGNPFCRGGPVRRLSLNLSDRFVAHYIANSHSTRRLLMELRGIEPDRISTVPNAIDLSRFAGPRDPGAVRREFTIPADAPVVGFVGRLHPAKGAELFLQVAAVVSRRNPEVFFLIIGDGQERKPLEQQAHRLGLDTRVRFAGERQDVPRCLTAFDVFVSASRVETFGIAILEAMAAGLPVVAFAVDAIPELLTGGGRLVPAGDVDACAAAVTGLLDDPAARKLLAEEACQRAHRDYGIEQVSRCVDDLYVRLLGRRSPPARAAE